MWHLTFKGEQNKSMPYCWVLSNKNHEERGQNPTQGSADDELTCNATFTLYIPI
jgi:hypothetical protein